MRKWGMESVDNSLKKLDCGQMEKAAGSRGITGVRSMRPEHFHHSVDSVWISEGAGAGSGLMQAPFVLGTKGRGRPAGLEDLAEREAGVSMGWLRCLE